MYKKIINNLPEAIKASDDVYREVITYLMDISGVDTIEALENILEEIYIKPKIKKMNCEPLELTEDDRILEVSRDDLYLLEEETCALCCGELYYSHSNEPLEECWRCLNCDAQYVLPLKRNWSELQIID